jgi:hypothetical protein
MPRAETEADRRNQIEIADAVCAANRQRYDGYIWLSEMNYRLDGCLFKKHDYGYAVPRLFFEAKQRNFPFGAYTDYRISVGKLIAARWLKDATGLRSALFARFSDGVVAGVDLTHHDDEFLIAGRRDRPGFAHDIEPMVRIGWGKFKLILDPKGG